ncbi:pseudouridine synthase [Flavihumibacter solisilvae]|uniref:Pseudouridine synthase n=1 Tax=Flavihumibacter solisilvae TaxID=1349421 RepID=A0A0C1L5G4_9BACT|nr:pseudouridine synthase [Flavihumibacter solisilvae]KIC95357.1 pseudouridine synthase [Flavihumibacter solisilvae]
MKKNSGFEKFANKKKSGTIKEAHKKERREEKKDRETAINQRFEEKRQARATRGGSESPNSRLTGAKGAPQHTGKPGGKRMTTDLGTPAASHAKPGQFRNAPSKGTGVTDQGGRKGEPNTGATTAAGVSGVMPLNKFIAHSGVCARRDAAALVKEGVVTVNGKKVAEPGFKVSEKDEIKVKGKRISISKNLVYILLNKPKDYITTTDDPQERKTVMDLVKTATAERVYPVGRLDRNTSGVLLLTNDGELAQVLSHPRNEIKKIYEVKLDKPLTKNDFEAIINGLTLEDGFIAPDALGYADPRDKSIIGIEIHSGKNRIVRRIFEHLKYDVKGLDRVMYAGLTKKNVNRGKWRLLTEREIRVLKHFNKAVKKDKSAK